MCGGEDVKAALPPPNLLKESCSSRDTFWIVGLISRPEHDDEDPGVACGDGNGQTSVDCLGNMKCWSQHLVLCPHQQNSFPSCRTRCSVCYALTEQRLFVCGIIVCPSRLRSVGSYQTSQHQ